MVLEYSQKECGHLNSERISIADFQSLNTLKGEKLEGWAWIVGDVNPAENWCTKPPS